MKKLLFLSVQLILILCIVWASMAWHIGQDTEKALKAWLMSSENYPTNGVHIELISYKNSLLGTNSEFKITDNLFSRDSSSMLTLTTKTRYGPIFINKLGVRTGKSQWIFKIKQENLTPNQKDNLNRLFLGKLPALNVIIDFNDKAHYYSETKLPNSKLFLKGVFDFQKQENNAEVTLHDFDFKMNQSHFLSEKISMNFQYHNRSGAGSLSIPNLKLLSNIRESPISLSVNSSGVIYIKNKKVSGYLKNKINNFNSHAFPVDYADLVVRFNEVSSDGLLSFMEINADIENLQQQAGWSLEENGELPEGQDQLWQIYDQIESLSRKKKEIISKIFNVDNKISKVELAVKLRSPSGLSELKGSVKPQKAIEQNIENTTLISQFNTEMDVNLSEDLHEYLSNKINNNISLSKKPFKLLFKDNKLLMVQ